MTIKPYKQLLIFFFFTLSAHSSEGLIYSFTAKASSTVKEKCRIKGREKTSKVKFTLSEEASEIFRMKAWANICVSSSKKRSFGIELPLSKESLDIDKLAKLKEGEKAEYHGLPDFKNRGSSFILKLENKGQKIVEVKGNNVLSTAFEYRWIKKGKTVHGPIIIYLANNSNDIQNVQGYDSTLIPFTYLNITEYFKLGFFNVKINIEGKLRKVEIF